jgi:hypothetical protein
MFLRTLAAVVTAANAVTGASAMFVGYEVETSEETARRRLRADRGRRGPEPRQRGLSLPTGRTSQRRARSA